MYNFQLYFLYIVFLHEVTSKGSKLTIFDNFDAFNGIRNVWI